MANPAGCSGRVTERKDWRGSLGVGSPGVFGDWQVRAGQCGDGRPGQEVRECGGGGWGWGGVSVSS